MPRCPVPSIIGNQNYVIILFPQLLFGARGGAGHCLVDAPMAALV